MISNALPRHGDATSTQFAARQVDLPLLAFVDQLLASVGHAPAPGFSVLKVIFSVLKVI
jgi:hypothetical protein